eukprot:1286297-Amphidinium_carterae.2
MPEVALIGIQCLDWRAWRPSTFDTFFDFFVGECGNVRKPYSWSLSVETADPKYNHAWLKIC